MQVLDNITFVLIALGFMLVAIHISKPIIRSLRITCAANAWGDRKDPARGWFIQGYRDEMNNAYGWNRPSLVPNDMHSQANLCAYNSGAIACRDRY